MLWHYMSVTINNRSVSCCLSIANAFLIFSRHPFLGHYKVGFNEEGVLQALSIDIYANAGHTMDLSFSVVGRAMFHATNSYKIKGPIRVKGYCCKTNLPSNTAFRGFGGPQGMIMTENW